MDPKTLYKISYGLYVVSSFQGDRLNGQIANTVFQIASEPATIAVSINKKNLTHQLIASSKVFSVSILGQSTPLDFIGRFGFKSGRDVDKFQGISYRKGQTGAPVVLENAIGYLEAEVINAVEVETHTVFIARVVQAEILSAEEPMTYAFYHEVKRGTAPPSAPTYIATLNTVKEPAAATPPRLSPPGAPPQEPATAATPQEAPTGVPTETGAPPQESGNDPSQEVSTGALSENDAPSQKPANSAPRGEPAAPPSPSAKKYECPVCGYVYDPVLGDRDSGVRPGTAFEDLPESWVCPICGAPKEQFKVKE